MNEGFLYNHPQYKDVRRSLRSNPTEAEKVLWAKLREKQLNGLKFRRQYGIGRYIVDFYCPELRLAIELDGESHYKEGAQEYDQKREGYIRSFDVHFLRFTNNQVYSSLDDVLRKIENAAMRLKSPPK